MTFYKGISGFGGNQRLQEEEAKKRPASRLVTQERENGGFWQAEGGVPATWNCGLRGMRGTEEQPLALPQPKVPPWRPCPGDPGFACRAGGKTSRSFRRLNTSIRTFLQGARGPAGKPSQQEGGAVRALPAGNRVDVGRQVLRSPFRTQIEPRPTWKPQKALGQVSPATSC